MSSASARVPMNARALAGWAESIELLARPMTDAEAYPLIQSALGVLTSPSDPVVKEASVDPTRWHRLLVAEAALRISLSRRVTSRSERLQELDSAKHMLQSIVELYRSERARMVLAVCLADCAIAQPETRGEQLAEALRCVERIQKDNPNASHAFRQHAVILMRTAEHAPWKSAEPLLGEAQRLLEQSRTLDPHDYLAICSSADVLLALAERMPREGAKQLILVAKEQFIAALKLDDAWPNAFLGMGWADLLLARRSSGVAATESAEAVITNARQALEKRPDSAQAYRLMGNARRIAGRFAVADAAPRQFAEAFQYFETGNKLRPDHFSLLTDWSFGYLSMASRQQGVDARKSIDLAIQKANAALEIEPSHPYAQVALGDAHLRLDRFGVATALASAREAYQKALAVSPDLEGALLGSALVSGRLATRGSHETRPALLDEASRAVTRVLDLRSDNENALEVLGDVLWDRAVDRTNYEASLLEARAAYSRAAAVDDQMEHTRLRLAEIDLAVAKIRQDPQVMRAAINASRAAARDFPDRANAHFELGRMIDQAVASGLAIGDPVALLTEGIAAFRQAAAQDSRNETILKGLRGSLAALAERQPEKRENLLQEAAILDRAIADLGSTLPRNEAPRTADQGSPPSMAASPSADAAVTPSPPPEVSIKPRLDIESELSVLRRVIRQMGVAEMWMSQIFERGWHASSGIPTGYELIDYPAALRELAQRGEVEILESRTRENREFYSEKFHEDIRFRVRALR